MAITLLDKLQTDFPNENEVQSLSAYAVEKLHLQQKAEQAIAAVKRLLDSQEYEQALTAAREALKQFSEEPELSAVVVTAEKHIEDQRREQEKQQAIKSA